MIAPAGAGVYFHYNMTKLKHPVSREEAVRRLRDQSEDVTVTLYPGAVSVQVRAGQGLRGDPEVMVDGWGYREPRSADRIGRAVIEAAAVAKEAAK